MVVFNFYPFYEPSKAAAHIFYVLYTVTTVIHITQWYKFKALRFCVAPTWAGIIATPAFVLREVSCYHQNSLAIYVTMLIFIYLFPPSYAASGYITLGLTMGYVPYLTIIHPGRVITTFLSLDTIVGILAGNGAGRLANYTNPTSVRVGTGLIRGSLLLQLVMNVLFLLLQADFHRRLVRANIYKPKFKALMTLLYISNFLIILRNAFRVADSFLGYDGYTETHEVFLYVFEAAPMLLLSFVLNWLHPAKYLPQDGKIFLSKDGVSERLGPGWKDRRNFVATVLDPFDLHGLVTGRDNKDRFWDGEDRYEVVGRDEVDRATGKRSIVDKVMDPFGALGSKSVTATELQPEKQ